jgi:hypothetical protein
MNSMFSYNSNYINLKLVPVIAKFCSVFSPLNNDNTTEKIVAGSKMTYKWTVKLVGLTMVILVYEDSVVQSMSDSQKRDMK